MILGQTTTIDQLMNILIEEITYIPNFNPKLRIFIANQEYNIPKIKGAWIVLNQIGNKVYSNQNSTFIDTFGNFNEEQDTLTQDVIVISIMSKNEDALRYKEGIAMALRSIYSQQQQEAQTFKIAQTMPLQNLSVLEGGSMMYRFDVTVNVLACYQLIKNQNFFDAFETQVVVNNGGTIIEEFSPSVLPK
jgi:hypothetical protein